ncbi:GH16761 [Drosophila grimshawi]|uniref:GH16761 n=2 Tax=Drosophila grimshawi TaxID=7222 RepID=B4J3Q1_DROGR|nr:GH16761 [Drosophila grimshawi]
MLTSFNIKRALFALSANYVRQISNQLPAAPLNDGEQSVQLPRYTEDQQNRILDAINENSAEQLLNYDITKARVSKLNNWKARNGPLRQLDDILYVEGFGLKAATKFYKSLLEPASSRQNSNKNQKAARTAPFITPPLDEQQRQGIQSSVGVRIGVTSVSWARLELPDTKYAPCVLSHWQHHEVNDKKLHLVELVRRCLYVAHQIPEADCYVLENPQMAQASSNPGSIDQQNVNIQKAQFTAMLSYALMARSIPGETKTSLFYLRRFLTARLFNHLVGTERVSSEDTILGMMRTYYNMEEQSVEEDKEQINLCKEVQFPSDLRSMYSRMERYQREMLSQAFLLNLAFVRLVLLQDPASIECVSRNSKKLPIDQDLE